MTRKSCFSLLALLVLILEARAQVALPATQDDQMIIAPPSPASFSSDQFTFAKTRPPTGCGSPLPSGVVAGALAATVTTISHGVSREYLVHVPCGYDNTKPAPVYFSFHGADRPASEQEGLSQFSNLTFNPYGIAVYPQGIDNKWLSNPNVSPRFPNDLDFMLDLLDELNSTLCINSSAIYAAGKSNGGGFTHTIACNSTVGPKFAAFAAVSGAFYDDDGVRGIGPCDSPGAAYTPFLELHGTWDCVAPYMGKPGSFPKYTQLGVPGFLGTWIGNNNCPGDWQHPSDTTPIFDGAVVINKWNCSGNAESRPDILEHYMETKLGHIWPSTVPGNDDCLRMTRTCAESDWNPPCPNGNYLFDGTQVIFDFFARFALPNSRN